NNLRAMTIWLNKLYFENLIRPRPARGRLFHRIALALADQGARDWRGERDAALLGVGFHIAHDLVLALLVGVLVHQSDGGAELHAPARQFGNVDHVGAADLVFQLQHAAFDEALALLGGM